MKKITTLLGFVAVLTSVALSLATSPASYAVSNIGPDAADYSGVAGGHEVRLIVASGSLEATQAIVYIYSKSANPTVTIRGADHCYASPSGPSGAVDASDVSAFGTDTTFSFFTRNNGAYTYSGLSFGNNVVGDGDSTNPNSGCNQATVNRTFNLTDADKMPASSGLGEYHQIRLQVDLVQPANSTNSFKVEVNDGIVSFANTGGNNRLSLQSRAPSDPTHKTTFNIYFATACDASPSDLARGLNWYDADQDDFSQNQGSFYFRLLSRPRGSGGGFDTVEIDRVSDLGGNNEPRGYGFTFDKSKEYDWQWIGVSEFNGVQFQIPFDSAYQKVNCEGTDYKLSPNLTIGATIVTPDSPYVNVQSWVTNTGSTSSASDEDWSVTRFIVPPGGNLANPGVKGSPPCSQFVGYSSCVTVPKGGWSATGYRFNVGTTNLTNAPDDTVSTSLQPGTKICYALSVSKQSSSDPVWAHSVAQCATVIQIPFTYVKGSDLRVGSTFNGSGNLNAMTKGFVRQTGATWGEYGVLAPGDVNGVASKAGAITGSSSPQSAWSKATFANTGSYGHYTSAANMGAIPNIANYLASTSLPGVSYLSTGSTSIGAQFGAPGPYDAGDFKGVAILRSSGTVTIDRDIKYTTGTLTGSDQLPQLIIIANNINIVGGVRQVDAWLFTNGTLNTCSDVTQSNLRTTNCNQSLHINGPIMAGQLLLNRTYYDSTKAEAAEILNLRGDAYLWASNASKTDANWYTTYTTDLPPRY